MGFSLSIFDKFELQGRVLDSFKTLGGGLINDTYVAAVSRLAGDVSRVVFQRVNSEVFPDVDALMENLQRVIAHLGSRGLLRLVRTVEGGVFHRTVDGECWRAFPFIEGAVMLHAPVSVAQAREAGGAFGRFSMSMADFPEPALHEVLPDFHNTEKRVSAFVDAVEEDLVGRLSGVRELVDAVLSHLDWATIIQAGKLPVRVAHNDCKVENLLFDKRTGEAVCVLDLDTTMPGCVLHDFGDLVRTMVATVREDETDLSKVGISLPVFEGVADGFLSACGGMLETEERRLLPVAGKVIVYEQALRFLTDYLRGDSYYRVTHPEQNLERARNQLRLAELLDTAELELARLVAGFLATCEVGDLQRG